MARSCHGPGCGGHLPSGRYEDPLHLYTIEEPGVCNTGDPVLCNGNWHSAAFSWDGQKIILGWQPGGGSAPGCEATDPPVKTRTPTRSSASGRFAI